MIRLTFAERYAQARTYAAQVRARKMMGDKYAHYTLKTNSMRIEHGRITHPLTAVR